ncbi:hypothetical protein ACU4GD_21520 [Cupriavidus basilensis]
MRGVAVAAALLIVLLLVLLAQGWPADPAADRGDRGRHRRHRPRQARHPWPWRATTGSACWSRNFNRMAARLKRREAQVAADRAALERSSPAPPPTCAAPMPGCCGGDRRLAPALLRRCQPRIARRSR